MASNKLSRTNEDIKFVLSRLLPQVKDPRVNQGDMISITHVDTTGDLRYCKVYLSVLGELNEKDFKKGLKSAGPWLRRELGSSLNLRYTPELVFELDKSIEHGAYISGLIEKLDIPKEEERADGDAE
ncbi:MAG: 30S ribosome-binding factor RbfA [Oscillospiraceae bacterium]|nr:30S ribosome-binding factor RbfA [Oscillospiraceae bacterium]